MQYKLSRLGRKAAGRDGTHPPIPPFGQFSPAAGSSVPSTNGSIAVHVAGILLI